jgi:LEA14-like dessication related protein
MPHRTAVRLGALVAFAALVVGCSLGVERPRLTVRQIEWRSVDPAGVTMRVTFAAYNANTFELPLHDMNATLTLSGSSSASSVTNLNTVLQPLQETLVTADVMMPWRDTPSAAMALLSQPVTQWRLEGTVTVERFISVNARFTQEGTITREQLVGAMAPSLRGATDMMGTVLQSVGVQAH